MHRRVLMGFLIAGLLTGLPSLALAESTGSTGAVCPICARASDEMASYPSKAGHTLIRGAANTLLGSTELIRQPAQEVKSGGNVFTGIAHGVGSSVKRTLSGAAEVLTFWTPKIQHSYLHFSNDCPICANK